jgi:hypothetical protein
MVRIMTNPNESETENDFAQYEFIEPTDYKGMSQDQHEAALEKIFPKASNPELFEKIMALLDEFETYYTDVGFADS